MTARTDADELGLAAPFTVDELVRAVLRWHFDPATGSPFWRDMARRLDFDPLRDVTGRADLARFPDVSTALTRVAVEELVPRGCAGERLRVFESGGTLGPPKRIVELGSRRRALDWVDSVLRRHGDARHTSDADRDRNGADRTRGGADRNGGGADRNGGGGGHWLHVGPTGPHIVGRSVGLLAARHGATCCYVDFDPRWVRRVLADGDRATARAYIAHVLDQAEEVLRTQNVTVMFATPPVIEAACRRRELEKLLVKRLRLLIWSGTSIGDETLRLLSEEIFPDIPVVGIYGNSLMGIAPQRPRAADDEPACVFQPYHPYALVEVVDPERPERAVGYGERGRVRVNLLTRDMFLPAVLERDTAIRVAPAAGYDGDGLAGIRPYTPAKAGGTLIEGVY
ncbi:hypothetical protein ACN27G_06740 [Plantactinospora sp. WMMB334]|uniref:hypothetical protein n=1 Tax=Plantactinospora sp. WMMB334 TaxID=3404119 RepID=UPI003B924F10